jgi:probable addiction module antidote protein
MKKTKEPRDMTEAELEASGLWKLDTDKRTLGEVLADNLSKKPKEIDAYRKYIIAEYNKTKEIAVFLENLKTLARAEGVAKIASKMKMQKPNVYRFLSKDNNPSFETLVDMARNLGIEIKLVLPVKKVA